MYKPSSLLSILIWHFDQAAEAVVIGQQYSRLLERLSYGGHAVRFSIHVSLWTLRCGNCTIVKGVAVSSGEDMSRWK